MEEKLQHGWLRYTSIIHKIHQVVQLELHRVKVELESTIQTLVAVLLV